MDVGNISTLFAVGAIVIGLLVLAAGLLRVAAIWSDAAGSWWDAVVASAGPNALWLGGSMAVIATAGSLYYSLGAGFEPCELCWYQRIAMYPLSLLLVLAALWRDRRIVRYVLPMASVGLVISGYHYLIQQFPDLSAGTCSASVPCTAAYIWKFEFVSIPLMAFVSFAAIITASLIAVVHDRSD
jgi:disulfide bond formation protein DsbB